MEYRRSNPVRIQMKRTKNPYPHFYHQWPGHLPFPPEDCEYAQYIFTDPCSGMRWLDIAFCAMNKCGRSPCQRRKEYTIEEWGRESKRLSAIWAEMSGK